MASRKPRPPARRRPSASRKSARASSTAHRRTPAPVVPGSVPEGVALASPPPETPHGHLICPRCGRIAELELTELDRHLMMEISRRRPTGWEVEGVTFSLTGTCPRCGRTPR